VISTAVARDRTAFGVRLMAACAIRKPLRILAYHGVEDTDMFARQIAHLSMHYSPVDSRQVVDAIAGRSELPERPVWLTFDDGQRTVVTDGLPILERAGIRATLFVCPGLVESGAAPWWDVVDRALRLNLSAPSLGTPATSTELKQVSDVVRRQVVAELDELLQDAGVSLDGDQLTADDLRSWTAAGCDLGNHSWDHPCLDQCCPDSQRDQLMRTHEWLCARGVNRPLVFAYPNGNITSAAEQVLSELGYDVGLVFDHRLATLDQPRYRVSRLRVSSSASTERFAAILSGWHSVGYRVKRRLRSHRTGLLNGEIGTAPGEDSHALYERADVVDEFASLEGLMACERLLFDTYVFDGAEILDLGVGAGRTTPQLSSRAGRYIAIDYSAAMVAATRARFPEVDVRQMDAADLAAFGDASFDVVVFSYNGLDYLHPREKRSEGLAEIARVTKLGGTIILSSHNARALVRPRAPAGRGPRSRAVQAYATVRLARYTLAARAFWSGAGYLRDSASPHTNYASTPEHMNNEAAAHGLEVREVVSSRYPETLPWWQEPWSYYVFRRMV
jgi:peptidoglycan/xylan/chitin deacetylase (PgdA/CDA1 family)/ubiquinone/menaquinone biosynthesis C-methylase UbiE